MCARLKRQKKTFTDNKVHMNDASYSGELRCSSLVLYVDSEGVYVYVDRRRHMGSSLSKDTAIVSNIIISNTGAVHSFGGAKLRRLCGMCIHSSDG